MSTERRKKKPRNEKIWICVAVCVVAALLIFAIVKMIAKKKPQNGGDDLSSVSSVSVESGGQSAETSSEISEEGQPSDGESSAAESSEQADSKAPSSSSGGSSAAAGASTAPAASVSAEMGDWMLRLASVAHPLPEGFVQPSVTSIDSQGREIDSRIVGAYNSLVNAAKADGINLYPISAFRPTAPRFPFLTQGSSGRETRAIPTPWPRLHVTLQSREQVNMSLALPSILTASTRKISKIPPRQNGLRPIVPNTVLSFAIPRIRNR